MKLISIAFSFFVFIFTATIAQDGEKLFKTNCASCHMLGKKLVGPDLIGVNEKYPQEWLLKWIKSSQSLIKAGDSLAVKLFNENNKIPMTDAFISEDEIKSILSYIKTKGDEIIAGRGQTIVADKTASVSSSPVAEQESNVNLLTMFSFTEYLLLGLIFLFLFIIWMLARTIRSLSAQLNDRYSNDPE